MMTHSARIVAMIVLLASGVAMVALVASGGGEADARERIVLVLAAANVPGSALPLVDGTSSKFTAVRVSTMAEVKSAAEANTAAIVVDESSRTAADWAWLQGQFRRDEPS